MVSAENKDATFKASKFEIIMLLRYINGVLEGTDTPFLYKWHAEKLQAKCIMKCAKYYLDDGNKVLSIKVDTAERYTISYFYGLVDPHPIILNLVNKLINGLTKQPLL